tara:strand:- start:8037 stop:9464 length:1428 start_codon:yes stop_codon:yes gene_type:complete
MATLIEQNPLYDQIVVGQDIIFTVSNTGIVSGESNVKFIAEVHISNNLPPNPSVNTDVIGTFKTTPNNAGVGIFDLSPVLESFVKSDNLAGYNSDYKLTEQGANSIVPIHLIDKYSRNRNALSYLAIQFKIEYTDTDGFIVTTDPVNSDSYNIFNGYLKYTDILDLADTPFTQTTGNNFGYPIPQKFTLQQDSGQFLTNAPTTQYANVNDYGTFSFLTITSIPTKIRLVYYNSSNVSIGQEDVDYTYSNGAVANLDAKASKRLFYFGGFPANLRNWSSTFNALVSAGTIEGGYYTVEPIFAAATNFGQKYTINVNCPNTKGFESIRLCWLNQWGAWDYYTFTMKSSKTISTKGSTYRQLEGTWNESTYKVNGFKGGKKAFRVNATEKITMNTDFVNESESEWFEELINSPEVYILNGFQSDIQFSGVLTIPAMNQYVTPVRLTTSSYTKKTIANDKVMQYTFEVEKSKTLRTQAV